MHTIYAERPLFLLQILRETALNKRLVNVLLEIHFVATALDFELSLPASRNVFNGSSSFECVFLKAARSAAAVKSEQVFMHIARRHFLDASAAFIYATNREHCLV